MKFPDTNFDPPFCITRASHLQLHVRDLERSKEFYTEIFGLVVSDEDSSAVYLRGVEEVAHHSMVLRKTSGVADCHSIGMRVRHEEDLDKAKFYFDEQGVRNEWVDRPFEDRTLRFHDVADTPIELCARMETRNRMLGQTRFHKGGAVLRLDHYQLHCADPHTAAEYYSNLGFRCSDYNVGGDPERITGAFMARKDNPHDIVYIRGPGPALHHFGYAIMESGNIFRACDVAAQLGYGQNVERGPQRHGLDHMLYVYFRDPDGHRAEIFIMPIQLIDLEEPPHEWGTIGTLEQPWGRPAPRSWFFETSPFSGVAKSPPMEGWDPMTLEKSLGIKN